MCSIGGVENILFDLRLAQGGCALSICWSTGRISAVRCVDVFGLTVGDLTSYGPLEASNGISMPVVIPLPSKVYAGAGTITLLFGGWPWM